MKNQNPLLEKSYDFWLCEEIGYEKEKITLIESDKNLPEKISDLNIVILLKKPFSLHFTGNS